MLTPMKTSRSKLSLHIGLLTTGLLATSATAQVNAPTTLKDAYKDHFRVGVAINRTHATGEAVRADNVNRTLEQVKSDTALALQHFDHIVLLHLFAEGETVEDSRALEAEVRGVVDAIMQGQEAAARA